MMKRLFILAVVVLFVFACAPRKVTTPTGAGEGVTEGEGAEAVRPEEEAQKIREQELEGVRMEEVKEPREAMITEEEKREIFKDIHFDFDKYDIKDEDKETLRRIADWLIEHPSVKLIIEGHCDERGTNEYNLGLGDRRANAAKEYLVSLGVSPSRIQTVSYGEERPLCTEHNESCWWKNRRAHFVVIEE
jgi:peptidoglycan-associated lipoprotein